MSVPARFLFDECIGKPVMERLHADLMTGAVFAHVCDYYRSGVKDRDWVPRVAAEGGWVVVTSDGGRQSKRGDKLPAFCLKYRVTHLVLRPSIHHKKSHEKLAALSSMWGQIERLHSEPPGTRFALLYRRAKGEDTLTIKLERVTLPSAPPPWTPSGPVSETPPTASGDADTQPDPPRSR